MEKCECGSCEKDARICWKHYTEILEENRKLREEQKTLVDNHRLLVNDRTALLMEIKGMFADCAKTQKRAKEIIEKPPTNPDALTVQTLASAWNEYCVPLGLAAVREVEGTRKAKALQRLGEHPKEEFWQLVFQGFQVSKFLQGKVNGYEKGHKTWRATFDWLVENDRNAVKVSEGNYCG